MSNTSSPWLHLGPVRHGAAAVSGVLALLVASCSSGGSTSANTTTTTRAPPASYTAYRSCLAEHGITLPSFGGSVPGRSGSFPSVGSGRGLTRNPKFAAAAKACAKLRPSVLGRGGAQSSAFAAYRNCLKLHGVTLPTPPSTLDTAHPTVKAALQACAKLRPSSRTSGATTATRS